MEKVEVTRRSVRTNGFTSRIEVWPGSKKYAAIIAAIVPDTYHNLAEKIRCTNPLLNSGSYKKYKIGPTFQFMVNTQAEANTIMDQIEENLLAVMASMDEQVKVKVEKVVEVSKEKETVVECDLDTVEGLLMSLEA